MTSVTMKVIFRVEFSQSTKETLDPSVFLKNSNSPNLTILLTMFDIKWHGRHLLVDHSDMIWSITTFQYTLYFQIS